MAFCLSVCADGRKPGRGWSPISRLGLTSLQPNATLGIDSHHGHGGNQQMSRIDL